MRITGGIHRSRLLNVPAEGTRPTSDKVRQAVFNILNHRGMPEDAVVLDGFCGSGAMGLEALSRGACLCIFMDNDRNALTVCRQNVLSLKLLDRALLFPRDLQSPGERPADCPAADLVFLDPPYHKNLLAPALARLAEGGWLAPGACIVAECEKESPPMAAAGFLLEDDRLYGKTRLLFLCFEQ